MSKSFKKLVCVFLIILFYASNIIPTFAAAPKITSISNITVKVEQSKPYTLPKTVKAAMSDKTIKDVAVTWDKKAISTGKVATIKVNGTVKGYLKKVLLIINITPKPVVTKGKVVFNATAYYEGDLLNGQPHGKGKANLNGDIFEGEFKNGIPVKGKWTYKDGLTYEGSVDKNWQPSGTGKKYFTKTAFYEGSFLNGKLHGKGVANWDGNIFDGEFVNDIPQRGKWTYTDGRVYEGEVTEHWEPTANGKWVTATSAPADKYVQPKLREAKGTPGDGTRKINVTWKPSTELYFALGRLGLTDRRLLDVNNSFTPIFDSYFANYKNHSAVTAINKFTGGNANILFYQNLSAYDSDLSLKIKAPFNTFTALQNFPKDKLEDVRKEALKFAVDTDFDKFLAANKDKYDNIVKMTNEKLTRNYIVDLEKYFGSNFEEYNLIISPLQFGGYGQEIIVDDTIVPAIIIGWKDNFTLDMFDYVVYHEYTHNFVKKVLLKHRDEILSRHGALNDTVPLIAKDGDWYDNLNEQLTHALSLRLLKPYYGDAYAEEFARRDVEMGWNYTKDFYDLLDKYEKNRYKYKNFDDFLPEIMNMLDTKL